MYRSFIVSVALIALLLQPAALQGRDRQAAREAFQKAREYHEILRDTPVARRTVQQYGRAVTLYLRVIDADPTYGAADDALYAMASLYDEMAERFKSDRYRDRAIHYYQFVADEYPLTRYRNRARQRARELGERSFEAAAARRPLSAVPPASPPPPTPEAATALPAESPRLDTPSAAPAPLDSLATVSEIRYWSNEEYTRVVIQLDKEVEFERQVLSGPDRIYFDLQTARLEPSLMGRVFEIDDVFIRQVRVAQNRPDRVRVVLDFNRIDRHNVFALYDPFRIVIDTLGDRPQTAASAEPSSTSGRTVEAVIPLEGESDRRQAAAIPPAPPSIPDSSDGVSLTRMLGLKVGRVVLDPGHGGRDTGTIGPGGLKEKDLVLDVALRLRAILRERLGVEVLMTRQTDVFVPLEERTAIANQQKADLFVSIHANASRNRSASGVETFYLDFASSPEAAEVAARENFTAQKNVHELENLLRQIALGDYNQESRELAGVVQTNLYQELKPHRPTSRNRGVKTAPFVVLLGANMPSILTEVGFLSNPGDEQYFQKEEARNRVAEALYQGIEEYFRRLGTPPPREHTAAGAASASSP